MLRNKEIRLVVWRYVILFVLSVIAGFAIDGRAGILSMISGLSFGILFFLFTRKRYQALARMAEQIDLVLHHADRLFIEDTREGELSILQSEIAKMTLRIREQNEALKKEKEHLADSLADIAHQLRTPLTSVSLILTLLEKNPEEQERRTLLQEAAKLFAQMEWLVNALLKLSRLDAGIVVFQYETVDVNRLIQAAVQPFLIPMELRHILLKTNVEQAMTLRGDFSWLSQAVQNILKNCMQSVKDHGTIEITGHSTPLYDEIAIHDSGAGFTKEDLSHMFERFYRGKNDDACGYGIGMALCRTIIARQKGTISARNHPSGGAVFSIRFLK